LSNGWHWKPAAEEKSQSPTMNAKHATTDGSEHCSSTTAFAPDTFNSARLI
jgi:hypothetical protein